MTTSSPLSRDRPLRAVGLMLSSIICFAIMNGVIKHLGQHYDVLQLMFGRSLFALLPLLIALPFIGGPAVYKVSHWRGTLWRSLFGLLSMFCLFYSIAHLPLADAIAINFSGPIFTALFATLGLREKTGWLYWGAVLVGFVGVIVIIDPAGNTHDPLAIFIAVIGSVFYGLAMVGVRFLAKTDHPIAIIFWFSLFATVVSAGFMPWHWQPIQSSQDWALFGLCGLLALGVQTGLTLAYHYAPATIVAPINYVSIIFVALIGYVVWGEEPKPTLAVGAVIVILANLLILRITTRVHESTATT